jgi:hypothetical protein
MVRLESYDKRNMHTLWLGPLRMYFSYETLVGWRNVSTGECRMSVNEWSTTTARHINMFSAECNLHPEERVPHSLVMKTLFAELPETV